MVIQIEDVAWVAAVLGLSLAISCGRSGLAVESHVPPDMRSNLVRPCSCSKFHARVDYSTDLDPVAIAVGDFDGNRSPDIAVVSAAGDLYFNTHTILINVGDGSFSPAAPLVLSSNFASASGNTDQIACK